MSKGMTVLFLILFVLSRGFAEINPSDIGVSDRDLEAIGELVNGKAPHGKFKGQALNTTVRRPLYVLGSGKGYSEALIEKLKGDSVLVANFFHNDEFYIARIPISSINSAVLLEAPFSKFASHTMLRFVTDESAQIELVAKIENNPYQKNSDIHIQVLDSPIAVKDFVLSIDGTEPRGKGMWNMKEAIAGSYTIAFRMVSIEERFRWFVMTGTPIHQTELNLTREGAQQLIRKGIETSQSISWSKGYHLLCANCTNLAIRLVKETIGYKNRFGEPASIKEIFQEKLDPVLRVLEPFTQFTRFNLGVLGWLGDRKADLQVDPAFKKEMMVVVQELRDSIEKNNGYSGQEKSLLFKKLGIDNDLQILRDPRRFQPALTSYFSVAKETKTAWRAGSSCLQIYN